MRDILFVRRYRSSAYKVQSFRVYGTRYSYSYSYSYSLGWCVGGGTNPLRSLSYSSHNREREQESTVGQGGELDKNRTYLDMVALCMFILSEHEVDIWRTQPSFNYYVAQGSLLQLR